MKRLMFMISTHGKSPGQATKEAWQAFQKYQKVEAQVLQEMSHPNKPQVTPSDNSTREHAQAIYRGILEAIRQNQGALGRGNTNNQLPTHPQATASTNRDEFIGDLERYTKGEGGFIFITPEIIDSLQPLSRGSFGSGKSSFADWQEVIDYEANLRHMANLTNKQHPLGLPSTLKEYEQSADSSTSEKQTAVQPEAIKTLEVRFVPVDPQFRKQPISVEPNLPEMPANIPSVDAPKLTIEDS